MLTFFHSDMILAQTDLPNIEIVQMDVGKLPHGIAFNPSSNKIYVANEGSNDVSAIDGRTNRIVGTISIPSPVNIAINPNSSRIYVTSQNNSVFVIDGNNDRKIKNYTLDYPARLVGVNTKTNTVYVTHFDSPDITVIDENVQKVTKLKAEGGASDLAVDSSRNKVYLLIGDSLYVINGTHNKQIVYERRVGESPSRIAIDEKRNTVYVIFGAREEGGAKGARIGVIDESTNNSAVINSISMADTITVNSHTNMIYLSHSGSSSISIIDGRTNKVVKSGTLTEKPTNFIDADTNPDTSKLYLVDRISGTVFVIDESKNRTSSVPTIKVGKNPVDIDINPDTNRIYVANFGSYPGQLAHISVIDGSIDKVIANSTGGLQLSDIGVNPDPETNEILGYGDDSSPVFVIDGSTNQVNRSYTLGLEHLTDIGFDPKAHRIYVVSSGNNVVSVIDYNNNMITNVSVMESPSKIAVNRETSVVYLAYFESPIISVFDGAFKFTPNAILDEPPSDIAVNSRTDTLYVASSGSNTIYVMDPYISQDNNLTIRSTISVGENPTAIAVNPNTNKIYVTNLNSDSVSVIDGSIDKVIANISVGENPTAIAVNPNTNKIYVLDEDLEGVSVIDGRTNNVTTLVSFKVSPPEAGRISCNHKEISTNVPVRLNFRSGCKAVPNNGFIFTSWMENLGSNSTRTIKSSDGSNTIFGLFGDPFSGSAENGSLEITHYGNFVANFREAPSPIPEGVWITLLGIMLGTFMPSIIRWLNGWKQRRRFYQYMEELPSKYNNNRDIKIIDKEITELYAKGKINESQQKILKDKVSELGRR
jgi:YVTN family beta-propeller protein